MPDVTKVNLRQRAVVWPHESDTEWGQPKLGTAYEVKCRWVTNEYSMVTQDETTSSPSIQVPVASYIPTGSVMWLGKLAALPASPTGLYEVVSISTTPDLKSRSQHTGYTVSLKKFGGSIPSSIEA